MYVSCIISSILKMAAKELTFGDMRRIQDDIENLTADFPDLDFTAVAENSNALQLHFSLGRKC